MGYVISDNVFSVDYCCWNGPKLVIRPSG